ncbi:DNA alkylation repair protein [Methanocalculus taiwanensis]|uniref:DNA alkylation repair protein n=1 Tax=Methanocalculus taiwanensis TaxID=106207 RepID=A0ABD4TI91_9EURY|nr:DNA alkylation repair protein [Methanocalculus taiwanensis]MCQ1537524.1 DNA alkylation repair protein [Methanocalculus taiwanensis]
MDTILEEIRSTLKERADPALAESGKRFFKEEVTTYGMKTAEVAKIARSYLPALKRMEKEEVFSLCEELFASGYLEESFIASEWLPRFSDRFEADDLNIFEGWILRYVTNWATCDTFCNHTIGDLLVNYPESIVKLYSWAESENRWLRRAAAVSLIVPAKKGEFLEEAFRIADILFEDTEDLVQKGYGWLLKEESRKHRDEVFAYVQRKKRMMPRTALRYAIELMPQEMRREAMKKDWR